VIRPKPTRVAVPIEEEEEEELKMSLQKSNELYRHNIVKKLRKVFE
jgi:hypothetical protein